MFSEEVHFQSKYKHSEKCKKVLTCTLAEENIAVLTRDTAGKQRRILLQKTLTQIKWSYEIISAKI